MDTRRKEKTLQRRFRYGNMMAARPGLPFVTPDLGGERVEKERSVSVTACPATKLQMRQPLQRRVYIKYIKITKLQNLQKSNYTFYT